MKVFSSEFCVNNGYTKIKSPYGAIHSSFFNSPSAERLTVFILRPNKFDDTHSFAIHQAVSVLVFACNFRFRKMLIEYKKFTGNMNTFGLTTKWVTSHISITTLDLSVPSWFRIPETIISYSTYIIFKEFRPFERKPFSTSVLHSIYVNLKYI